MGFECSHPWLIWLIALGMPTVLFAVFGIMDILSRSSKSSFQIHDECPDWFIERVNAELDRIFKERRKKEYPSARSDI